MPLTCLIIDDNQPFLDMAQRLLEREGLRVVGVALTTEDAVRQAARLHPDVILVDVFLGAESGLKLARELVEHDSTEATVILISTHTAADLVELIATNPAAGFLTKAELSADAIRRLVDGDPGRSD